MVNIGAYTWGLLSDCFTCQNENQNNISPRFSCVSIFTQLKISGYLEKGEIIFSRPVNLPAFNAAGKNSGDPIIKNGSSDPTASMALTLLPRACGFDFWFQRTRVDT